MTAFLVLFALAAVAPVGAEPSPAAREEIDRLFADLERSGCRFSRNETWHSAAEARDHLARKFRYLAARGLADTAEAFIEMAASRSSQSGRPYQVQCGDGAPRDSGPWFREAQSRQRSQGRG